MNVLHVVPTYLPATRYGGPIHSVHGLCRALAGRGHTVAVYTTNVDGPCVSDVPVGRPTGVDDVQVTYFATGLGRRLYRSPDMAAALARSASDFDVVHMHSVFLWPTSAAASAARRAGVPYVISPRGMLVPELVRRKSRLAKSAWIAAFEHRNLAGAASIHMTADTEAEDFRRLQLRARRIDVIPNGIDLPADLPLHNYGAPAGAERRPVVLSLGRVNWKKGLERLIQAIADVPQAELVIAGNDEEGLTPRLLELARQSAVAGRLRMIGPVHGDEKWRVLASADVFALPSYSENFGIAVLEAMACGVPVVITPQVGLAAAVAEIGCGVVADGLPAQFGRALAELLADPERRRRMGEAGRKAALERFSWSSVAREMEALYAQLSEVSVDRHVVS